MKIKFKKNMSFGFGWALPTLPPLTSRHCIQTLQRFMFDCVIKFLLDAKLIDSKNYDNSEVFFFVSVVTKLFIIHSVSYKMHHPLKIKLRV
jgi:hypothetical protein